MSNRDRIARLQAEADVASREKATAASTPKASKPATAKPASKPRAKAAPARIRIVWAVCESSGKQIKQYPYPQEAEAIADAKQRTQATGKTHFVARAEVPD